ncbi:MAG TPA: tartrate-resistant acid phosphatase type 5 family protein [Bacteroidales bacterium]
MITNKTVIIYFLLFLFISTSCVHKTKKEIRPVADSTNITLNISHKSLTFFIISDWGWNGWKFQKEVADEMATLADSLDPKFIVSCGDNFQIQGVASAQDPLWLTSFENIYSKPSLQVDWYPVLGNHDYRGNTQAEIDYSKISRRWRLESHYYTFARKINDSISARLIFLDTPPLVDEYYEKPGYPDIFKQDSARQMKWLKDVLANSKEQWKLVFGHHPVYSASQKHGNTPELIRKLKPLFDQYHVQFYICGHDHDMQHLREKDAKVDYIVTGTGGEPRPTASSDISKFSKSVPGFSLISLYADSVRFYFIDSKGKAVYTIGKSYKD